jgi:3-hydroxybutyryl-CoA dehydrogenase
MNMNKYMVIDTGASRSFEGGHEFLRGASSEGEIAVYIGKGAGRKYVADPSKIVIILELDGECLGVHTGEEPGLGESNVVGFNRFRLGESPATNLIELVTQTNTSKSAAEAARALFEGAGFDVAVCKDFIGRIVNRLIRPMFNDALRALDEGVATVKDLDLTVKLGLGYRKGFIDPLYKSGLHHHYDVTSALFEVYGQAGYAPTRRGVVAKQRSLKA